MFTVQCRSKSLLWRGIGLCSCRLVPFLSAPLAPTSSLGSRSVAGFVGCWFPDAGCKPAKQSLLALSPQLQLASSKALRIAVTAGCNPGGVMSYQLSDLSFPSSRTASSCLPGPGCVIIADLFLRPRLTPAQLCSKCSRRRPARRANRVPECSLLSCQKRGKGDPDTARCGQFGIVSILNGSQAAPFSLAIDVAPGDTIDFAAGPGPGGNNDFDSTGFNVTITPEL